MSLNGQRNILFIYITPDWNFVYDIDNQYYIILFIIHNFIEPTHWKYLPNI